MSARIVVIALGVASASCGLCLESCRVGVAVPNGSGGVAITGGPAELFAMYGIEKTATGHEEVALFNALILKPEGSGPGSSGGSFEFDCVRATETIVWTQDAHSPRLQLSYDGGRRDLRVGDQAWPTTAANTFVISLDEHWEPTVRALPLLIKSRTGAGMLKQIQDRLPGDARVARLREEPLSSIEPQNNQMQRTSPAQASEARR